MSAYFGEKYAAILTKDDVAELFNMLVEKLHGNRSEAARQCDLTGKATYDWETADYLKLETKRKVLDACLRFDFLGTTEYLLERSNERTVDLLRAVLSTIYANAIETESRTQFISLVRKFNASKEEHKGLIRDRILDETEDMWLALKQKASELKMSMPQKSIEDISARELLDVFPLIGDMYLKDATTVLSATNKLDIPLESVEKLLPVFEKLHPVAENIRKPCFFISPELLSIASAYTGRTPRIWIPWTANEHEHDKSCLEQTMIAGAPTEIFILEDANIPADILMPKQLGEAISDSQNLTVLSRLRR